ncbi:hypothetical protein FPSE_06876 [Fusarium pseudograminearum CS3096]|uniref:Rhodopsin domain-containing protein n=1 Tax=Fusarium pseudograminearum (strain CS3096) TaxID=1028729 RepID=K3VZT9_FUSPC|nr:hypothetical protein FPSE_06876 [Fusarium pseudograminearum CS3096]EKJ72980.1 hypothetical protein FPSE_06876 [Fusarium pseudograminearum CS3096]
MISSKAVMSFEWSLMTIAYVLVAARVYVRVWLRNAKIYSADYLLFAGLAACQGLLICDTMTYRMNAMDDFTISNVALKKIRFATNYFFDFGIYFPKFSIIAFYFNLVPFTHPGMRALLYALAGLTASFSLVTLFSDTFWCGPDPSVNWLDTDEEHCQAFMSMKLMRINWAMNFTSEVLNVLYPLPLLKELRVNSRRKKAGLTVIFGLGLITIFVSIGRFIQTTFVSNDISIYIWATAEICISVMVVASTALRPLLRKMSNMSMLSSLERTRHHQAGPIRPAQNMGVGTIGSGTYWNRRRRKDSLSGSETEINTTNGIVLTRQVMVSRETIVAIPEVHEVQEEFKV